MKSFCPNCEKECDVLEKSHEEIYHYKNVFVTVPLVSEFCIDCGERLGSDKKDQEILDYVKNYVKDKFIN